LDVKAKAKVSWEKICVPIRKGGWASRGWRFGTKLLWWSTSGIYLLELGLYGLLGWRRFGWRGEAFGKFLSPILALGVGRRFWNLRGMLKTFSLSKLGMEATFSYGLILGIQPGIFLIGIAIVLYIMLEVLLALFHY
jgi:hypothetical protein